MESKAKLFGHPIHQMLVAFPVGLFVTGVLFDIVFFATNNTTFALVAYWMIIGGIVGGLVAAPFGFFDWLRAIPAGTRAKRIGRVHGTGNLIIVGLFIISAVLRAGTPEAPPTWAYVLSFVGAVLLLGTAWLGAELVDRMGIGVYENANPDAPSSLGSGRTAPARGFTERAAR